MDGEVRFDDLAALDELVSEELGDFGPAIEVSQEMIDRFADLTGDRQWIHVDEERCARESPYRRPIAHGFLLLSLLPALTREASARIVGAGSVINYGADKLRFTSPVVAGSRVRARRRIAHVRRKGVGGSQITFESEVWAEGADRPALSYRSIVLFLP